MTEAPARGRPQVSSREMLQDAAFELFVENSYAKTTVEQITQRAGVSRATFFNYFPTKSDVFWIELDKALDRLGEKLRAVDPGCAPMTAVLDALLAVGAEFGPSRVPFALTQHELVGSVHELRASALDRFSQQARQVAGFLTGEGMSQERAMAAAYASLAAAIAGAQAWAAAGTSRGPLEPYLRDAVVPVTIGFESALPHRSL